MFYGHFREETVIFLVEEGTGNKRNQERFCTIINKKIVISKERRANV